MFSFRLLRRNNMKERLCKPKLDQQLSCIASEWLFCSAQIADCSLQIFEIFEEVWQFIKKVLPRAGSSAP